LEPLSSGHGSLPVGHDPRVMASFANPDLLCSYLVVGLALTLAAWKVGWLSPRRGAVLAGAVTLAAVFTFSPGWAGIALVWSLWAWTHWRMRRPRLAIAALAIGVGFAALMLLACAVTPLDPYGEPGLRWRVWHAALQTVLANPWIGVGVGQAVVEVIHIPPDGVPQRLLDAHNIWLNVAGQAGVFAALALAGLLSSLAWKPAAPGPGPSHTLRFALVLALLGAWGFQGLTSSLEDARHLWLMLGLLAACRPEPARHGNGW
jgi:O-antigen ligase